jgi:mersacidin/lichenicidin family type 2 lantibiotic
VREKVNINRALRDREYFLSLTDEERAQVPPSPAGDVELQDNDLSVVSGGSEAIVGTGDCSQNTSCSTKYTSNYCCA